MLAVLGKASSTIGIVGIIVVWIEIVNSYSYRNHVDDDNYGSDGISDNSNGKSNNIENLCCVGVAASLNRPLGCPG